VDEELLIALCSMTEDEYLAGAGLSDCPEGYDAIHMVGNCEPEWDMIRSKMISSSVIFNAIFWVVIGATALLRRRARKETQGAL
jgi:predicted cobalt transporter CbtA